MIKLYNYFRSSASFRVRIALHWKDLPFEYIAVHLLKDGGQQNQEFYRKVNPMGFVPAFEHNGFVLTESMAILHYLDQRFPQKRLFPEDPRGHAEVIALCEVINSGIQPLQNLRVQRWLEGAHKLSKAESDRFVRHWIEDGFKNLEKLLEKSAGQYAWQDQITAADCFVVPQCVTAKRFGVEVTNYPTIARVNEAAGKWPAFHRAQPDQQPDFQP